MTTYTASFRTDADWASRTFNARTSGQALAKARAFHRENGGELLFQEYDSGSPVNKLEISGAEGDELAVSRDEDLRLRLASRDLLEALELCEVVFAELARLHNGTPSMSALHLARAAIARAKLPVG